MRPLHDLSKKNAKWTWGPEQTSAFEALKKALSSKPVLRLLDLQKPFVLHTDASKLGTGVVVSQADDSGTLHPCTYMSQLLTGAEQNYQVYDLEMLAVMCALKQWRPYLLSPPELTHVYTDHQNITYYVQPQKLTACQARWQATLQEYLLQFVHVAGTKNSAADTLSCHLDFNAEPATVSTLLPKAIEQTSPEGPRASTPVWKVSFEDPKPAECPPEEKPNVQRGKGHIFQLNANLYQEVKKASASLLAPETTEGSDGVRRKGRRIFVPEPVCQDVLWQYHDTLAFGHPGVKAMMKKMNKYIWWPGMYQSIHNYCKGCPFQEPLPVQTDLPLSGGRYNSILTIVDQGLTKGTFFLPTTKTVDSVGVTDLYHAYVYPHWGVLEAAISDHGPQFVSAFTRDLYQALGIELKASTAYHPQTNSKAKRVNQEVSTYLRMYADTDLHNWHTTLSDAQMVHNSCIHSSHDQSPYLLMYGFDPTPYPMGQPLQESLTSDQLKQLATN
ncbi:hypothetical protein M404DRAFT_31090 [Pisolithus tinctorius Marx 270]|uniref:Integrase catalytic domain-containing protein n=1 Tax=Pisolithus tinctorius Marx 270 TaxID=870435 RepID=A0A0C3IP80_PISTI|nr:hypothetical protein M404DRAFT_31090 [Pisolithus tinctorius Marx 270]